MKNVLVSCLVVLAAACSSSSEDGASSTSSLAGELSNLDTYTVRFIAKDRCLTVPTEGDLSRPSTNGPEAFQHGPCGKVGQSFLFKKDDIKAAGHFGPYVTERQGKVLAGSSSPWTVVSLSTGSSAIQSRLSGQCLVAGARSEVVLGRCDDADAAVRVELQKAPEAVVGAVGTVACSTDNQGNAVDCQ